MAENISEAVRDFRKHTSSLTELYAAVRRSAVRVAGVADGSSCLRPRPYREVHPPPPVQYNIEETDDGYWRLRYSKPGEYMRNPDGSIRMREYLRKNRHGVQETRYRSDVKKGSIYLHHLSMLVAGIDISHRSGRYSGQEVSFSCSHLCGNPWCCFAPHLTWEPHPLNLSRSQCWNEVCVHLVPCLRSYSILHHRTLDLESLYLHQDESSSDDEAAG